MQHWRLPILCFALFAVLVFRAWAATVLYVDANLTSSCVGATYSVASRNCSGSDGAAYKTPEEGFRALTIGDTLRIRAGSYTISSTYGNVATDDFGGGATSWAGATVIENYPGETVTITVPTMNFDESIVANSKYIIFRGDSRANFIFQGASGSSVGGGSGFRFVNGANHIRLQKLTIRNFGQDGAGGGSSTCPSNKVTNIEVLDNEITNNGDLDHFEHGVYFTCGDALLIEGNYVHGNRAYGVTLHNDSQSTAITNSIIRNNLVVGKSGTTGSDAGIEIGSGSGNTVYNNIVNGQGSESAKLTYCFQYWGTATAPLTYNNTCNDVTVGVEIAQSSVTGAEIKNNIFASVTTAVTDNGTGTVRSTNLCPSAATGCSVTGSPSFTNAATGDFTLQSGSTARDAGADLSATLTTDYIGTARPQNSTFDIGAHEYIVSQGGASGGMSETPAWSSPRRSPLWRR